MTDFRRMREQIGTQAQVARLLEISLSTLQRWERHPSRVALLAIYAVLQHHRKGEA